MEVGGGSLPPRNLRRLLQPASQMGQACLPLSLATPNLQLSGPITSYCSHSGLPTSSRPPTREQVPTSIAPLCCTAY